MRYLQARRAALGGMLPARRAARRAVAVPPLESYAGFRAARRRQGDVDDDGLRAAAQRPAEGQDPRAAHRARSSPTRRAPSAWRTCSARSASTRRSGQLYEPEDAGSMLVLSRGARRADCWRKASPRPARSSSWIAAATAYSVHGLADAAVLYLLLDVRLPARRRSDLGGGRSARARLPDRRDGRAHHARRRRACSIRTAPATSSPRPCRTAAPTIPPSPTRSR